MSSSKPRESLLKNIKDKRSSIRWFIDKFEPMGTRLTNFNIICAAIATALTTTSAIGGKPLIDALGITAHNSLSWRIMFATAALFSLLSTIAASLYKSYDIASRLGKAQVCDAKFEKLETLLEQNQIDQEKAVTLYTQYIEEISFIRVKRPTCIDLVKGGINEPKKEENKETVVESTFYCSGWVKDVGPECHLWLAVEANDKIWYKEAEIIAESDGSWQRTVFEQGKLAAFSLSLYVVTSQANKRIRAWLDGCIADNDYNGMRRIPGTIRLHKIELHRANIS